jgi:hypothetical protein
MSKKPKPSKPEEPSLRDYFAGLSLQALLYAGEDPIDTESLTSSAPSYAQRAYLLADAMLEARDAVE